MTHAAECNILAIKKAFQLVNSTINKQNIKKLREE